jgi:p-cumate 2,3-dioxygenase beta subunit
MKAGEPVMQQVSRSEVEDFLYLEADLLDNWKLNEWAELFTADAQYLVPSTDAPDGDPRTTLFLIYDDRHRLGERAKRLLKKGAHAEYPHSQTRHIVTNVRILSTESDGEIRVACNFVVYRSKGEVNDIYPGHSLYHLVRENGQFRIRLKRATLNVQALRPQGKVSVIL